MDRPAPKRSAGVVVLRRTGAGWRVLVLRAYRNWDFPKGLVAPGEQPLEAAIREVREETGIGRLWFPWGPVCRETAPYAGGKVARYYLGETDVERIELPVSPELGRPEHHEWRWATFAEARSLVAPRLAPILDWAESVAAARPTNAS